MQKKISDTPEEIIEEYKLHDTILDNGYVHCRKGMYGLSQAGIILQQLPGKTWLPSEQKSFQDYGRMKQDPPPSHLLWTTLQ